MSFDKKSFELIYVYIKKYKIFKEQSFCLCPEYDISCKNNSNDDCLSVEIKKKKDVVDLFKDKNVNLTVICGKNGCGKTTLLEAIQQCSNDVICLFKDDKEEFFATEELVVTFNGETIRLKESNVVENNFAFKLNDAAFIFQNVVEYYTKNPELFDGILHKSDKLFSHFCVKIWNLDERISRLRIGDDTDNLLTGVAQELQSSRTDFEANPFLLYALSNDRILKDFLGIYREQKVNGDKRFFLELLDEYLRSSDLSTYDELFSLQKLVFQNEHKISEFKSDKSIIIKLEEYYKAVLNNAFDCNEFSMSLDSFVFYDGYAKLENGERHIDNLSSGELQEIKYRQQLFNVLKNKKAFVCCVDEPEKHLHPEWCRKFLCDFLKSFQETKKILEKDASFVDRKITFVISTHSPFILSDVTNDNIIYLERQDDGSVIQVNNGKNVFAGNIGELFTENFFMGETIGEFASEKIRDVIRKLQTGEAISSTKLEECKQIIGLVGDDLLRKLLCDMWERKYEENKTER